MYTQNFTLNDLHVDCFGRLKPAVMLWLIQEVSGIHAGHLGASWEALAEKNLFWAIIRHKVEVFRPAYTGQTITLRTWPMPTTRVAYPRATEAWDENGNLLFMPSGYLWIVTPGLWFCQVRVVWTFPVPCRAVKPPLPAVSPDGPLRIMLTLLLVTVCWIETVI